MRKQEKQINKLYIKYEVCLYLGVYAAISTLFSLFHLRGLS